MMKRLPNKSGRPIDRSASNPRTALEAVLWSQGLTYYALHKRLMAAGHNINISLVGRHTTGTVAMGAQHAKAYAQALGVQMEDIV